MPAIRPVNLHLLLAAHVQTVTEGISGQDGHLQHGREQEPGRDGQAFAPRDARSAHGLRGRAGWAGGGERRPEGSGRTRTHEMAFHGLHVQFFSDFLCSCPSGLSRVPGASVGRMEAYVACGQ